LQLHLRGNLFGNFKDQLLELFPAQLGHKIYFHKLVPHKELLSRIAEHDIGLATEEYTPDSRNLTITNKILQYLLGGIAVLATDTKGQQEVAETADESVFLFRNKDKTSLVNMLNHLIDNKEVLQNARQKALNISSDYYCWEIQQTRLVQWINSVLK
jgi:glycosyltransferase involved in cell wall biosynthesis